MKFYAIFFLFIFLNACNNFDFIRPVIQAHIDSLNQLKEIPNDDSAFVEYFKDSCSRAELLILLQKKNPIVKLFVYRAIVERNDGELFDILKQHLSDTSKVEWWYFNDAAGEFTVADLMIRKAKTRLSALQKDTLIELVLNKYIFLQNASWMIESIKPQEKYYKIIRGQAFLKNGSCNQARAIYGLAKFKKSQDIELIRNFIANHVNECAFLNYKIIKAFPAVKPKEKSFSVDSSYYYSLPEW